MLNVPKLCKLPNLQKNSTLGTLTKSEDPDETPQKAAFHRGLHCLLR